MTKLFVGGIPYSVTNQSLEEMFSKFGAVSSATIIVDKYSGQSKGFAFVEMTNDDEAQAAIKELDGFAIEGRKIGVSVARPREESGSRDNSGRNNFSNRKGGGGFQRSNYRR